MQGTATELHLVNHFFGLFRSDVQLAGQFFGLLIQDIQHPPRLPNHRGESGAIHKAPQGADGVSEKTRFGVDGGQGKPQVRIGRIQLQGALIIAYGGEGIAHLGMGIAQVVLELGIALIARQLALEQLHGLVGLAA